MAARGEVGLRDIADLKLRIFTSVFEAASLQFAGAKKVDNNKLSFSCESGAADGKNISYTISKNASHEVKIVKRTSSKVLGRAWETKNIYEIVDKEADLKALFAKIKETKVHFLLGDALEGAVSATVLEGDGWTKVDEDMCSSVAPAGVTASGDEAAEELGEDGWVEVGGDEGMRGSLASAGATGLSSFGNKARAT